MGETLQQVKTKQLRVSGVCQLVPLTSPNPPPNVVLRLDEVQQHYHMFSQHNERNTLNPFQGTTLNISVHSGVLAPYQKYPQIHIILKKSIWRSKLDLITSLNIGRTLKVKCSFFHDGVTKNYRICATVSISLQLCLSR